MEYTKLNGYHQSIERTILNINDISSASAPELYSVTTSKRDTEEVVIDLESNLSNFTKEGKGQISNTQELLQRIEKTINTAGTEQGESRFTDYESGSARKEVLGLKGFIEGIKKGEETVTGLTSSYAIYQAAKNRGLSVSKYTKNGKVSYRINASEDALKALGVKPDSHARKAIKQNRNHRQAPLNYHDRNSGKQVWSRTGKDVINTHPALASWNDKATLQDKAKSVARATGRGTVQGLKDAVDVKGIANSGLAKGATKALGPLSARLSYYGNYHDAQADGLSGKEAHSRAVTNTAVDVTVSSAVQAGFTAAGTAFIPIPGVGTAVGVVAGIGANALLNMEFDGKSMMDRAKGAVNKIKGWFS